MFGFDEVGGSSGGKHRTTVQRVCTESPEDHWIMQAERHQSGAFAAAGDIASTVSARYSTPVRGKLSGIRDAGPGVRTAVDGPTQFTAILESSSSAATPG